MTGTADHPHGEPQKSFGLDPAVLESMSDDELEAELTVAASAPGRRRWERYKRLVGERQRRRLIAA